MQYLALDIGGTNLKYALIDHSGNILEDFRTPTPQNKEDFLAAVDKIVEEYQSKINGFAFCAPGKIVGGTIDFGGALPFLDGVDFKERYQDLNIPVWGINDGKAGVLAESWRGSLKDCANCAAVVLGTGVGGGIIVNGQLIRGFHEQAGELSFMQTNYDTDLMHSMVGGNCSAVQLIEAVNQAEGNSDLNDGFAAFQAINAGEKQAVKLFTEFCDRIAILIINLQSVVDLEKISIGGGISAQDTVITGIREAVDRFYNSSDLIKMTFQQPEIVQAAFRNKANLYGALYNLLLQVNSEEL
ncbi:ROK family protein [Lactobacillus corticis]|uniref:Transcriptional regulator / sugar kinase NagC n=1 Tax=Lactobacillus corticis TaxID=2201249 RepID=A0A916QKC8_9LACO|nr:ROK family protein [Lactobacillus corticis]GFZ27453.1 transcriptional regulator / sugar kinase NagC [Lactobacillus corticis]